MSGYLCAECPTLYAALLQAFAVFIALACFLIYAVRSSLNSALKGKSATTVLLRIMFNYMQTMSVMSFIKVTWHSEVLELFKGLSYVGNTSHIAFGID